MTQLLLYVDFSFDGSTSLETILATESDAGTGFVVEKDVYYSDNMKQKSKHVPFCSETKNLDVSSFKKYIRSIKPCKYKPATELIYDLIDQTDQKNNLRCYGSLKFFLRHAIEVSK